ncbi:MAG: hypothetical protein JST19_00760 [Bacteroidetes bacterium]|nr:hypothetical protein [Bacteroidota bacterium]
MDTKKIFYSSQTYNAFKAFLYFVPFYITLLGTLLAGSLLLHKPLIAVIGWVLLNSVPFLFQKRFKRIFTRRVELEFDDESFSIKEYHLTDDVLIKQTDIAWRDIKSYKCYFSASSVTYLTIYLENGSNKSFSFKDGKDQDEAVSEKSAFSIFYYFVKQYNSNKEADQKIYITPGFLTTRPGLFLLCILGALVSVGIILHIILQPKSSLFSVMGLFIVLGLVVKRKKDKDFYDKISQLQPRFPVD